MANGNGGSEIHQILHYPHSSVCISLHPLHSLS